MKHLRFVFITLLLASTSFAAKNFAGGEGCGEVLIRGNVVVESGVLELRVFNRSDSELHLRVSAATVTKALPFDGQAVEVIGKIKKPIQHYRGEIEVRKITPRNPFGPSPLESTDSFKLVKREKCP